jgi:hypothetical protein
MCNVFKPVNGRLVLDHFDYRGVHGCPSHCALELIPLANSRIAAIATELTDNPGTSITNAAELLASLVCDQFRIDPDKLIWIEHYGYAGTTFPERGFDRVICSHIHAMRSGRSVYFKEPHWQRMVESDWIALGLPPRPPVHYQKRRW